MGWKPDGRIDTAETPPALRALFLLDPGIVFLNHGSFGACPRPVFDVYQEWQRRLELDPVDLIARRLPGLLDDARAALAAFLGASPERLAFVRNATTGVNIAARALGLRSGDEVLGTTCEYGACELALQRLCGDAGARYERVPFEELLDHVTSRTRALLVSHVSTWPGGRLPVEEVIREARALGVATIVDGAHAPGQIDLSLDELDADFYSGNCHKWLSAPRGAGFLYVHPAHRDDVDGAIVGWGYREPATLQSRLEQQGTQDPAAYLAVPSAVEFHRGHDVRDRCVALCRETQRRLCTLLGTEPLVPAARVHQMAGIALPRPDPELGTWLFEDRRIEVASRDDGIRVSVATYTDPGDVDLLAEALASRFENAAS